MDRLPLSYSLVIRALCHAVATDTSRRVAGPSTGYRCKATYSLFPPPLMVSDLVSKEVNALCKAVEDFRDVRSSGGTNFYRAHPTFFFEVCGKVTRKGEAMVKIVFLNDSIPDDHSSDAADTGADLFTRWYNHTDEPQALFAFLKARIPSLACVVAHARLTGQRLSLKPDKSCAYLPICGTMEGRPHAPMAVTEYTPNGFPFLLSADSFCEVNQPMEDAIYHTVVEALQLQPGGAHGQATQRRAFICGRDVNSVVKTFVSFYSSITVATTCPNVLADTVLNGIEGVHFVKKDAIGELLLRCFGNEDGRGAERWCGETHVLITAGRHGLHPSTTTALSQLAEMQAESRTGSRRAISDIVYVSCNVESFARDLFILKRGLRVVFTRTFDFFPGTNYVMTVVHLRPLGPAGEAGLLLLPVGPPGVGKSTCGRAIQALFTDPPGPPLCDSAGHGSSGRMAPQERRRNGGESSERCRVAADTPSAASPKTSIPRTFAQLAPNVRVTVFERDRVFHALRNEGKSLKQAKVLAHQDLLSALSEVSTRVEGGDCHKHPGRLVAPLNEPEPNTIVASTENSGRKATGSALLRSVVYLDTTNGSAEARQVYRNLWKHHCKDNGSPAVTLWFDCPARCEAVLLERVSRRVGHPCFPQTPEAQQEKVALISAGIEAMSEEEKREHAPVVHIDATRSEEEVTVLQTVVHVVAFLHFTPPLAVLYAPIAVALLASSIQ